MNNKKIMILGGGYYQLPLIKKSCELGYYTIVCGIEGNYPGYQHADKWYNVDNFDKEACLSIAKKENINGICVCGTDIVLPTLGYVVDNMNLKGPNFQSSVNSSNKYLMKEKFLQYNVRTAGFKRIFSKDECIKFADENQYPVVLKVVDSSGSKGIAIIKNKEELILKYPEVAYETKKNYIIAEEFIEGEEFGAQAFVKNKKITFVMPHGDIIFYGDTGIPIGHYAPYKQGEDKIDDITDQLQKTVAALEINNTAINADFILKNGQVYVLEIGARAGATCLPELVSEYYGINYYEYILKSCVGEKIDFKITTKTPCYVEMLTSNKTGIIKNINIPELPKEVVNFCIYPKVGEEIKKFNKAADRIGHIVLKGSSIEELIKIKDKIFNQIEITV